MTASNSCLHFANDGGVAVQSAAKFGGGDARLSRSFSASPLAQLELETSSNRSFSVRPPTASLNEAVSNHGSRATARSVTDARRNGSPTRLTVAMSVIGWVSNCRTLRTGEIVANV